MKLELKRKKDTPGVVVEIPDSVCHGNFQRGQLFEMKIRNGTDAPQIVSARILADGRSLMFDNQVYRLSTSVVVRKQGQYRVKVSGEGNVLLPYSVFASAVKPVEPKKGTNQAAGGDLKSPMAGKVIAVPIKDGDAVEEGATLVIIEAMKMENRILAECAGTVRNIKVEPGKMLSTGELLLTLVASETK